MDFIQEVGIALDNIYQLALNIKPLMIGLYGILAGSLILNIILIRYILKINKRIDEMDLYFQQLGNWLKANYRKGDKKNE